MASFRGVLLGGVPLLNASGNPIVYDADTYPSGPPADCCCPDTTEKCGCDPADTDPDPETPEPLDIVLEGAIQATDTIDRSDCGNGGWAYFKDPVILDADGCGDPAWNEVSICVWCDITTGEVKATMVGGSASCSVLATTVVADSVTCDPFVAVFTFETEEVFPGGCPCGDAQPITLTVTQ